jgi:hypothetical protein
MSASDARMSSDTHQSKTYAYRLTNMLKPWFALEIRWWLVCFLSFSLALVIYTSGHGSGPYCGLAFGLQLCS